MPIKKLTPATEEKLAQMRRQAEERDAQRKATKTGCPYINLITAPINIEALALVPQEKAEKAKVAAIEFKEKILALVVFDPNNSLVKEIINELKSNGYQVSLFVASLSGLKHVWSFYKFISKEAEEITGRIKIKQEKLLELQAKLTSLENIKKLLQDLSAEIFSAGQILEATLAGALANRASDVHFEPEEKQIKFRLRIDGLLHDVFNLTKKEIYNSLSARIKLLSGLKINVRDEPQDGRFSIDLPDKKIEIRTSLIPSEFGETIVLRILDPETIRLSLSDLGLREDDLEIIKKELIKPNGMILNTGPTGSGKTTTLYTFLNYVKNPEIKIITIEDPIEYHLEGIEQTQVDPEAKYTFATGLRSILRQDPDMILIGEVRDLETASIAMHAALTGHLVFSTLHTNEASGAIPRLIDIGIKAPIIGPALNLVIAQRLVRRLCPKCRLSKNISPDLKKKIDGFLKNLPQGINKKQFENIKIFQPQGCDQCNHVGYRGRIGIFELFLVDREMEEFIVKETAETKIKELALKKGMVTMQQDGFIKVLQGLTTFEEVERITGAIEW